jgi:hypothetical protein
MFMRLSFQTQILVSLLSSVHDSVAFDVSESSKACLSVLLALTFHIWTSHLKVLMELR